MPLSCSCSTDDDAAWYYRGPDDYRVYPVTSRRRKCSSCGEPVIPGSVCTEFERYRASRNDIEERIYGDERPIASMWMCEKCSDLYFSFIELGYQCVGPWEHMGELAAEYADLHDGGRPKS